MAGAFVHNKVVVTIHSALWFVAGKEIYLQALWLIDLYPYYILTLNRL
jgi:hypothetical protein